MTSTITAVPHQSGVSVIEVSGEHDLYNSDRLRATVEEAMADNPGVVIDLTGTTFIDSSTVGVLLEARELAINTSTGFAVCISETTAHPVKRIFDITGLNEALPVIADYDKAILVAKDPPN